MIILSPDVMTEENIKLLRDNQICVVVAKDPAKVRFVDPIPASSSRTQIEDAAIKLSRVLLNRQWGHLSSSNEIGVATFSRLYIECLMGGTPLDANGTKQEQEQRYFDSVKRSEVEKLAKEEAKAERAAAKAAKSKL